MQAVIEDEVLLIRENPGIGEYKKGDLLGIQVHKFNFNQQEYLIAYRYQQESSKAIEILMVDFIKIGTHENFYSELKKYLKTI